MPEKKKQHYVPKLLLRHFSENRNKKTIGIFNPDNDFFRQKCSLDSQGKEDYFYGKDGVVEDFLGGIEDTVAPIIQNIIDTSTVPKKGSDDHQILFLFCFQMAYRTKNASEMLSSSVENILDEIYKYDKDFQRFREAGVVFSFDNAPAFSLGILGETIYKAYDLKTKLIINNSKNPFITSDNPCIKYNQFLEKRGHPSGHLGMLSKGLQVFLPINDKLMLLFYDDWAYDVGRKDDRYVSIKNPYDINKLNLLQLINCYEVCFFNEYVSKEYLNTISNNYLNKRGGALTKLSEFGRYTDTDGNERIQYRSQNLERRINLGLSFIKPTKKSIIHRMNDFVVQLRDEKLRETLRN